MDDKNAFRQVPVDPDGAAAFEYALGRYIFCRLALAVRVAGWSRVVGRSIGGDAAGAT